jgi:uncharacterized membrane protein YfcA
MLGGGGSILTVPVLHYVFGTPAHDSIAMSLAIVGVTSIVALVPHVRAGRVRWVTGLELGASSMLAAFAGGRLGGMLPEAMLIMAFALLMVSAGIAMIARARRCVAAPVVTDIRLPHVLAIGVGVGLVTGTLGAGGGFLIVPALTLAGGLGMREAVATSLLVIAMNSLAGLGGVARHARFDIQLVVLIAAVAVAGSFAGARLGRRISAQRLQVGFGAFVILVGSLILLREAL